MVLYANERLAPVIFAVVLSIGSKLTFRAPVGNGHTQHFFNPSRASRSALAPTRPSPLYRFLQGRQ